MGQAFRNTGMSLCRNLDRFLNSGEGSCILAIQSVGVCQIRKNPRLGFQTRLSRPSEAESIGQILDRRRKSSRDDVSKTTTGQTIDSQVGIAAFYGQRISPLSMLLSQSNVSLHPCEVDIGPTRYDVMESINLTALQLNDAI